MGEFSLNRIGGKKWEIWLTTGATGQTKLCRNRATANSPVSENILRRVQTPPTKYIPSAPAFLLVLPSASRSPDVPFPA